MNALTRQDIDVLIEAMEAWESRDFAGDMMEAILGGAAGPKGTPQRDEFDRMRAEGKKERQVEQKNRKERSIMLKAKLLGIRDGLDADRFIDQSKRNRDVAPPHRDGKQVIQ